MATTGRRESLPKGRGALRDLAHHWFVQYNPLYFFSAFSVLSGIYLVARDLGALGWEREKALLTGVLQTYEILLILGSVLLFRTAGQRRPAVILGLLESVFFFDCTFQIEALSNVGRGGLVAVAWTVLAAVKAATLVWAFRLKPSLGALALPVLGALGLAGTPALLALEGVDPQSVHLLATWYFAGLMALVMGTRPIVRCAVPLDAWGRTVLHRAVRAVWMIWGGLSLAHLLWWTVLYDVELALPHAVPLVLLLPFLSRKEPWAWVSSLGALALSGVQPATVAPTALVVVLVLGWYGWQTRRYRLWVGAVLALYVAGWTAGWRDGPLPEPQLWLGVGTSLLLLLMAWRLRLPTAALLAPIVALAAVGREFRALGDQGWGILLLVIGFYSLAAGIVVNWREGSPRSPTAVQPPSKRPLDGTRREKRP